MQQRDAVNRRWGMRLRVEKRDHPCGCRWEFPWSLLSFSYFVIDMKWAVENIVVVFCDLETRRHDREPATL
jgi:hypothetical protein